METKQKIDYEKPELIEFKTFKQNIVRGNSGCQNFGEDGSQCDCGAVGVDDF